MSNKRTNYMPIFDDDDDDDDDDDNMEVRLPQRGS